MNTRAARYSGRRCWADPATASERGWPSIMWSRSKMMADLCRQPLPQKERIGRIVVAYNADADRTRSWRRDWTGAGAMTVLPEKSAGARTW